MELCGGGPLELVTSGSGDTFAHFFVSVKRCFSLYSAVEALMWAAAVA
jgi:hypothetical protein